MSNRPASRCRQLVCAAAALLAAAGAAGAHDFWIEPDSYAPAVGAELAIRLRVGMNFQGESVARRPDRIEWFAAAGPQGERPIEGAPGADPAGRVRLDAAGIHVIGYRSNQTFIEMSAPQFSEYLAEEGLQRIIALRLKRGQDKSGARELYSRCAKALVLAGGVASGGHDRILGFPLELVPESSPYEPERGGALSFRLLFRGQPLEAAEVTAINRSDPRVTVRGRTDKQGRVGLSLARSGVWLVKTVHMFESLQSAKAEWESLWATLTFELPARAAR